MSLSVTRIFDADMPHCSPMVRAEGAHCVFINGLPWSRMTDRNTPHLKPVPGIPPCIIHQAEIAVGSPIVIPQKLMGGNLFKPLTACTQTAVGSPNVFCGG